MSEYDIFPDAEQLATDILVAANFDPYTVDIGTELPSEPTYPAIIVARIGGIPRERHRLDHPNLQFDVWATTKGGASDVARIARTRLHEAEGKVWGAAPESGPLIPYAVLTGVEDALGLAWQFDTVSNIPRYTFGVYFTVHVP